MTGKSENVSIMKWQLVPDRLRLVSKRTLSLTFSTERQGWHPKQTRVWEKIEAVGKLCRFEDQKDITARSMQRFKLKQSEYRASYPDAQPNSLRVSTADIHLSTCARNLGFMTSNNMSLDKHITTFCCSVYLEIR